MDGLGSMPRTTAAGGEDIRRTTWKTHRKDSVGMIVYIVYFAGAGR